MPKNKPFERKRLSLRANYIFNFISQILTLIVPIITTPYLSRIFHESGNGQIAFANTIVSYFITFANLGYSIYGQREIAKHQDDAEECSHIFWEIMALRLILTIASVVILLGLVLGNIFDIKYKSLILIYGIQVLAVPFDIQFLYQGEEDFKSIAIRTIILRVLTIISVFVFVKSENDIWLYALLYSCSVFISDLIMWPSIRRFLHFVPLTSLHLKRHLLPALIIFLPTLAVSVYGSLDKLMIGYLAPNPDYDNGCYDQAMKINQTILVFVTVIDSVMIARNSADFGKEDIDSLKKHISQALNYVWFIGIPLIVGMCILANNLCSWFLGNGYEEVPLLLCIMSVRFIVSGLNVVFGNELFVVIGKEKYTTVGYIVTGIINLILNFVFIPRYGAVGGAITTAVAEGSCALVLAIIALKEKYVTIKQLLFPSFKPTISAGIMFIPIYFMEKNLPYAIWSFLVITLVGFATYLLCLFIMQDNFVIYLMKSSFQWLAKRRKSNQTNC